ncbi:MAG TPA: cytochrome c maturation protein CcmE [Acidobacteriaceae bacterium]|nr:cytochrome c maturation protein CcmE [Acidobacteriaceae bacterium]
MRSMAPWKIVLAVLIVVGAVGWLSWTAVDQNKEYYVTISELSGLGGKAYSRHLRVAGNVQPGSIERDGPNATFVLLEQGRTLKVNYQGAEPPPDTFKDDAQALAVGTYGRDGVFHATQLQAKCASKYAPAKPGETPAQRGSMPSAAPASNNTAMVQPAK